MFDTLKSSVSGFGFFSEDWDNLSALIFMDSIKNDYSIYSDDESFVDIDFSAVEAFINLLQPKQRFVSMFRTKKISNFIGIQDDKTVFRVHSSTKHGMNVGVISRLPEEPKRILDLFRTNFKIRPIKSLVKGSVKLLVSAPPPSGLSFENIGKFETPFVRTNYSADIEKKFDQVLGMLKEQNPFGRLVLLHGSPGTGKSFFIKSLVSEITNSLVLFVPASMVGGLTAPNFVGKLLEWKENEKQSIILIVEDADEAIQKRQNGNVGVLSDILNLTDGLLGELIDVRVIATTNKKTVDIDEAVLRKGRLFDTVNFEILPAKHWEEVAKERDLKGDFSTKTFYSLAEFYQITGKHLNSSVPKEKDHVQQYI